MMNIVCFAGDIDLVVSAVREIRDYDKALHDDFVKVVKRIVFIESPESIVLLTKRAVLIAEDDQSHLSSKIHLAGWLLYYYVLVRNSKTAGWFRWNRVRYFDAKEEGRRLRDRFSAGLPAES